MEQFVFKKDGKDNQSIISKISKFIERYWDRTGTLRGILIELPNKSVTYPCHKMLFSKNFSWSLTEVFDSHGVSCNYILQFMTGENLPLTDENAIWMGDKVLVTFEENQISIKRTGGETFIKAYGWN